MSERMSDEEWQERSARIERGVASAQEATSYVAEARRARAEESRLREYLASIRDRLESEEEQSPRAGSAVTACYHALYQYRPGVDVEAGTHPLGLTPHEALPEEQARWKRGRAARAARKGFG